MPPHYNRDTFDDDLNSLIGRSFRINTSGDIRTGTLLSVKPDYIVIQSEHEDLIYYFTRHIHRIEELAREEQESFTIKT